MADHHPTLSPSSWPALAECGQFKSAESDGDYIERGQRMHEAFAAHLDPASPVVPQLAEEEADEVEWAVQIARDFAGRENLAYHVEDKVELLSEDFQQITFGTADAWILKDEDGKKIVYLFDLKTGEVKDFTPQLAAYAAALIQQTGARWVCAVLIFSRYRHTATTWFDKNDANEMVDRVVGNVTRQTIRANKYCGWCEKAVGCYAFAKQAMAINDQLGWMPDDFTPEVIKDDPDQMAKALRLAKHVKSWASAVEDHAKTLAEPPPGWRWSIRKTESVPNIGAALDALGLLPASADLSRPASLAELSKQYSKATGESLKASRAIVSEKLAEMTETKETKTLKEKI